MSGESSTVPEVPTDPQSAADPSPPAAEHNPSEGSAPAGEAPAGEERLRQLSHRALALQESERRGIARDLHDSAGQALTAIRIHLQILAEGSRSPAEMRKLADETMHMTDVTLEDLRRAVQLLTPAVLAELGLARALEREIAGVAERRALTTTVELELGVEPLEVAEHFATLDVLSRPGMFAKAERAASQMVKMLNSWAQSRGIPFQAASIGSMWGTFFTDAKVTSYETAKAADTKRYGAFFHAMLREGVYLAPSQFEAGFTSVMHDDAVLGEVTAALSRITV